MIDHLTYTPELVSYYRGVTVREPDILRRLRNETLRLPNAQMQISPEQGQFFHLLAELLNFRCTIEIGVFTGYSCLNLALALPPDGRIVACDINKEWTDIAQRYWKEAGIQSKIEFKLGPAVETLRALVEKEAGNFDFVFVDGDKESYDCYYELSLVLLRTDGLMALDNMLRGGRILNSGEQPHDVEVLRALNAKIQSDERVTPAGLPFGDGLTLVRKR
ncbi:MAG: class I SAM-dependent methyltransferase [Verrucomicrobia bacterium]|nr:class I SAM-dependent methyltransferase [Verrucomicrobiota bacterium]